MYLRTLHLSGLQRQPEQEQDRLQQQHGHRLLLLLRLRLEAARLRLRFEWQKAAMNRHQIGNKSKTNKSRAVGGYRVLHIPRFRKKSYMNNTLKTGLT